MYSPPTLTGTRKYQTRPLTRFHGHVARYVQRSSVGASGGISHPNHNNDRFMTPEKPFNLAVLGPHMASSTWARSHRQGRGTQTGETGMRRGGGAGTLMSYSSCKTANSISPSRIHLSPVTSQHHHLKGSRLQDVNRQKRETWWPVRCRVPTKP